MADQFESENGCNTESTKQSLCEGKIGSNVPCNGMIASASVSSIPTFTYNQENLGTTCKQWLDPHTKQLQHFSGFDNMLRTSWSHAMSAGCFRYNLESMKTRILPGSYKLVAQLNEKRFAERRKPQEMTSLSQPFDNSKFNFTKVPNKEVLFEMCAQHRPSLDKHIMIINVSPLEFGNSLLVPNVNSRLPQILTVDSLELALETSFLSSHRGFRIGFNSLCAYASVNHLHFHVWYLDYPSSLESISLDKICDDVHEVTNYPTRLFAFVLQDPSNIAQLARKIHKITTFFVNNEIAHNLLILRGQDDVMAPSSQATSLRVFLWPRKPVLGAKDEHIFNIAVCELGGHLPIRTSELFYSITEQDFNNQLKSVTLQDEEFESIKRNIVIASV